MELDFFDNTTTNHLLMIRPKHFGFNEETAQNNAFQKKDVHFVPNEISSLALDEFDRFAELLRSEGLKITVIEDKDYPVLNDSVFPNNWFSTHSNGMVVIYPLFSKMRRLERRMDIFDQLGKTHIIQNFYHLEDSEKNNRFLEGTGSLILDRKNKIVFACKSIRTDPFLLNQWAEKMQYQVALFTSQDENGTDIYHTNVMMAIAEDFVIWGGASLPNLDEKERVERIFKETGKEIIDISMSQIHSFAGNMLAVKNKKGENSLIMSSSAFRSLTENQISQIEKFNRIIIGDIPTIEKYGGGSVRCMLAEIFLKNKY